MTQPQPRSDAEALRANQHREYSQFVAVETIYVGSARAFNVGDPVPASHVSDGVVSPEQVAKTTTKAAAVATSEKG